MSQLTGIERISRILTRKSADRVGVFESFWPESLKRWRAEGKLGQDESPHDHFGHDMRMCWPFNYTADVIGGDRLLEETAETKLVRNGNGAILRWWKHKAGTPEHVDFEVKDRAGWEAEIKPRLLDESLDVKRTNAEAYRKARAGAAARGAYFVWGGINAFECIHPVCGHEYMLMGMVLDPDWVREMSMVYADLNIRLMDKLFAAEGRPDGIWYFEDMGFKERPFMSPAMYKDIVWPAHKKTFDHAHSLGLKVIVHSCGFVEPLVPGLIEAGMDCLQAMEVKAGMDLVAIKQKYGDRIALIGGLDVRPLVANDRDGIMRELTAKLPAAMAGGGYVLHSDHSIPGECDYETYKFFVQKGLELGTYGRS
jgi:uroporphyrinogen decarboxylase